MRSALRFASLFACLVAGCSFDSSGEGSTAPDARALEPPTLPDADPGFGSEADAAPDADLDVPMSGGEDAAPALGGPSDPCTKNADCASGECRNVGGGAGSICIQRCGFGLPACPSGFFCFNGFCSASD